MDVPNFTLMETKAKKLREFILAHIEELRLGGSSGSVVANLPDFELHAQDYLEFADQEIAAISSSIVEEGTVHHKINCVSHLKRAVDCQIDTFLHVLNLYKIFSKRNLKFETKLKFLSRAGIYSSRSLSRLNQIRNKMEHQYRTPQIEEIEVYFDLVTSFVSVLQLTWVLCVADSHLEMYINGEIGKEEGKFTISYNFEKPSIRAYWFYQNDEEDLVCSTKEPNEFAFFFKVFLLLHKKTGLVSNRYVVSHLDIEDGWLDF